jgi:hypothetical protein
MADEEFYRKVADILGVHYAHIEPASGNTSKRWGPRRPGNGRFPGHGIVRMFSPTDIHIAMNHPPVSGSFKSPEAALSAIRRGWHNEVGF